MIYRTVCPLPLGQKQGKKLRQAFALNPRKIALFLGALATYFALQSLIMEYLIENVLDADRHWALILAIDLFSVNAEETIPTWFATLLLFVAAALLAFIASGKYVQQDRFRHHWTGLAVIFLYLSMDEGAAIHEIMSDVLETTLQPTGYLYFAWQIAAAPLVILFAVLYLRFVFHLPARTRNLFFAAGLIYVGGAMVVEGISANRWYLDGGQTFEYLAIATIEEFMEMLGVVVLIYTLLSYGAEMRYSAQFNLLSGVQNTSTTMSDMSEDAAIHAAHQNSRLLWRPLISVILVILSVNVVLVGWSLTQVSAGKPEPTAINQGIFDQLATYDVQVTHMDGQFGFDNINARQMTAKLLADHADVMIVSWASGESSIALAADALPFDRNGLTEILYASGETQFVIYDTDAVAAIVGAVQSLQASQ